MLFHHLCACNAALKHITKHSALSFIYMRMPQYELHGCASSHGGSPFLSRTESKHGCSLKFVKFCTPFCGCLAVIGNAHATHKLQVYLSCQGGDISKAGLAAARGPGPAPSQGGKSLKPQPWNSDGMRTLPKRQKWELIKQIGGVVPNKGPSF